MYSMLNYSQNNYIYIYITNLRMIHAHTTDEYLQLLSLLTHLCDMYLYIY